MPAEVLEEMIWFNKVGAFGLAPAGCWLGRVGAFGSRLSHHCLGYLHMLWLILCADEELLVGRWKRYEVGLMLHFFMLLVIKAHVAWHKVCCGI